MKKKIYFITVLLTTMIIISACSDNQGQDERHNIVTGQAVDVSSRTLAFNTSIFGEDTEEWCPNVEENQLYCEELKKGKNYSLYISNYPQIDSRNEAEGMINIGDEDLYYSILTTGESEATYIDDNTKQENTVKYKLGYYKIYKRVGNRFYTLWIDQKLNEKVIKKKAKKIFDKYCTL